uniref:Uncharacterized protein n=1 Tax=Vitrella brassicaformis TaxID=1169539 RepID=A0A7S1JKS1_9ALVE
MYAASWFHPAHLQVICLSGQERAERSISITSIMRFISFMGLLRHSDTQTSDTQPPIGSSPTTFELSNDHEGSCLVRGDAAQQPGSQSGRVEPSTSGEARRG